MEYLDQIKLSILMKGRGKIENYGFRAYGYSLRTCHSGLACLRLLNQLHCAIMR